MPTYVRVARTTEQTFNQSSNQPNIYVCSRNTNPNITSMNFPLAQSTRLTLFTCNYEPTRGRQG